MRLIKMTQEAKDIIIRDFCGFIDKLVMADNKINYSKTINQIIPEEIIKPTVFFTSEAYLKMLTLVLKTDEEVGWHGCVKKQNNIYTVYDIVVYPQEISSVTVTTDDADYGSWLHNTLDDDTFNHLRFQGHSHVNMVTTPSCTDTNMYENILQTLTGEDYYIFAIMNKKMELNLMIYDFLQEVIFDKEDIVYAIITTPNTTLAKWYLEQTKNITQATYINNYQRNMKTQYPYNQRDYFKNPVNPNAQKHKGKGAKK